MKFRLALVLGLLVLGLIALSLSPMRLRAAEPFAKVGEWYDVAIPSAPLYPGGAEETIFNVKILHAGPDQWYWVLSQSVDAPPDLKRTAVIKENKFWLNLAQASRIWPSSEIDKKFYQKRYAGGVKVEEFSGP